MTNTQSNVVVSKTIIEITYTGDDDAPITPVDESVEEQTALSTDTTQPVNNET